MSPTTQYVMAAATETLISVDALFPRIVTGSRCVNPRRCDRRSYLASRRESRRRRNIAKRGGAR